MFPSNKVKQHLDDLKKELILLKQNSHLVSLKAGTEAEDMGSDEISIFKNLSENTIPLTVKIGGAEARQDIRAMLQLKVDCILSPMIESAYALKKFVEAVLSLGKEYGHIPRLAFNLETISAVQNLDTILRSEAFTRIDQITIGRGDLSQSMDLNVEDDKVLAASKKATEKIKRLGKRVSLGGGLALSNIKNLSATITSDFFNTRHVVFLHDAQFKKDPEKILFKILNWEKKLCSLFAVIFPAREKYYKKRLHILSERLGQISLAT